MRNLSKITILTLVLISLCGYAKSQTKDIQTIEEAKARLEVLHAELSGVESEIKNRIEKEIPKQVSTAPKDEFESTKQYSARMTRAASVRRQLKIAYETEKRRRQSAIRGEINKILEMEFTKSIKIGLQTYDADEQVFPVSGEDSSGSIYEDSLKIPPDEARNLKESLSLARAVGLFGVSLTAQGARDYYFGVRISLGDKNYSSLPSELKLSDKELLQYYGVYTEPAVVYLRKVIIAYLNNRKGVREYEVEVLDKIEREYLSSKFVVASIEPHIAGGKYIKIIFQDRPDAIFAIWIYRILEVRTFEKEETDERAMRLARIRYKPFLLDRVHSR